MPAIKPQQITTRSSKPQAGFSTINRNDLNSKLRATNASPAHAQPESLDQTIKSNDRTRMFSNQPNFGASSRAINSGDERPIMKYMEASDAEQKSVPLKYFKGQDLELYYMEKQLKPGVEREIKEGFFEIRKKFGGQDQSIAGEEV